MELWIKWNQFWTKKSSVITALWKLFISGGDKCRLWALRLITLNCSMPNCSIHFLFMYDMGWCYLVFKSHDHFVQITTLWHRFANQSKIWGFGVTIRWWPPTWQIDHKYQTLAIWKTSKLHLQHSTPHDLIWNIFILKALHHDVIWWPDQTRV